MRGQVSVSCKNARECGNEKLDAPHRREEGKKGNVKCVPENPHGHGVFKSSTTLF
jgi:hypothetical protein